MKGRLAADNIRRLLHIIDTAQTIPIDCAALSLDAEKAFDRSVEPLEQAVREHTHISPITIHGSKHFISLYADDILLFLSNISSSIPSVLSLFN